ncbi:hypothetical protein CRU98_03220 [Arcobacter sp. CECT 8986]|uniref:cache domain-containing protein n=1 Tax=Arcobacter sp. CECT 8986 TaxID=2044507 RepID=UPI001009BC9D|nr:cache domain-containing protein [Arcobacter sp. CECT 8986]RXK00181.1 hypothetical protein CRU98_03220 [Arcobacter sp. CECT 8986]
MTGTISVSVRTKILIISIFVVFSLAVASLLGTIVTVSSINESNISDYKNDIYTKNEDELQNNVQIVIEVINSFYKRSINTSEEETQNLKEQALQTISQIRYSKTGYFWINDSNYKMLMHPILKDLDGKNLKFMKDKNNQYMFQEFVTLANENKQGGIVMYMWPKPDEEVAKAKFSFVKKFEPWDWIVGTGTYLDEVDAKVAKMKEKSEESLEIIVIISAVIFIIVLILLSLITLALSTRRSKNSTKEDYE